MFKQKDRRNNINFTSVYIYIVEKLIVVIKHFKARLFRERGAKAPWTP